MVYGNVYSIRSRRNPGGGAQNDRLLVETFNSKLFRMHIIGIESSFKKSYSYVDSSPAPAPNQPIA